jgi:flagellar M-ring protein FliF
VNQILAALQRFGIGRLAAILGIGAGVAAVLVAITMGFGQPKALLYSNLDLKEAGQITQTLDQASIKYEVRGDGSSIFVPRDQVASTRLMLSGKGLPTSGSVGYEIFDNSNALGQTDFIQQLNRQRALEGELGRTIRSLDGISSARVHLVLPRRQLFAEETEQPSAAVTIGVGGREPGADQVRAIQNLVSGAVPNLKPDKVTVVDQHAKTLSGGDTGMAAEADGRKSEIEQRISKQVKTLVEGVVGAGKARVNVSADVDMAHVTTQKETFDPDGQVVRSEVTTDENSKENSTSGGTVGAGGAPGQTSAAANIPGGTGNLNSQDGNSSGKQESTTNYEISKTVTTQVTEPGQIKKISVAVAVDGVTGPPGKTGKQGAYTPRPAAEMAQIESLVKAAVGFDQGRGDQVTVVNVKFPTADDGEGVSAASPLMGFDKNDIMRAAEIAVMGIVAILMMLFIVRPLLKGALGAGAPMAMLGGPQVTRLATSADGQPMQISVDPSTGQPMALPAPEGIEAKIDIARIEGQVKASSVKRVAEFVDKHPEESVSIIRNWLHESA